ncbi:MAG TPA: ABC transporter permease [Nitrososphaerales archaeon]|nr:ABC transporter permease [Nitrososphaerales archaeon]
MVEIVENKNKEKALPEVTTSSEKFSSSFWRLLREFVISPKGLFGITVIAIFIVLPYLRPFLTKYPPLKTGAGGPNLPPSHLHLMGTTSLGQDVYSQFLAGGFVSVEVGILTGVFSTLLVIAIGIPAGYFRGIGGQILTLFTDVFLVIPVLPLIIILAVYSGPSVTNQIIILTLLTWPFAARVVRAQVLSLRERTFVESGVAAGGSSFRLMFGEILPNVYPLVLSNGVLTIVFAILFQAAIAFLGLGDPTVVSWGNMLYNAELVGAVSSGEWWWVIPPGLGITVLALAFSLVVLQLDKVFNIRSRTAW